jgi:hypothetical protein
VTVLAVGACQLEGEMPIETFGTVSNTPSTDISTTTAESTTSVAATQGIVAPWEPAPGVTLSPETQILDIVVLEQVCSGGDTATGRIEPEIQFEDDAVIVIIRVRPKPGFQNCPYNPLTPFTLDLGKQLGSRVLLQGGEGGDAGPPGIDVDE